MVPSRHQQIGHPTQSTNRTAQLQLMDDGLIEPASGVEQSSIFFMRMSTTPPNHPKRIPSGVHSASRSTNPVFPTRQAIHPIRVTHACRRLDQASQVNACLQRIPSSSLCLPVPSVNKSIHRGSTAAPSLSKESTNGSRLPTPNQPFFWHHQICLHQSTAH